MLAADQPAHGQEVEVSGQVTSAEDGAPLPGVNVVVQGTTVGTATGADGSYALTAPSPGDTLVFSYIGFVTEEVPINGRSTIDVALSSDTELLNEVVVVGYGTLGRESVTAAITKVTGEDIADVPVPSAAEALNGLSSGVTIAADSPGQEPHVRIRGLTTPNTNSPLFVVDGVPVGGLLGIKASDVESIEVLKDASAAAIYGSRAAGGVVLVTTKRGADTQGIRTEFNAYAGVQAPWKKLDLLNTQQYVDVMTDIAQNGDEPVPARFDQLGADAPSIDYQDEIFRTAPMMNYDLAFSGGNQDAQYRISLGYLNQEGTLLNTGFDRYSLSVNTDFQIGRFSVGESVSLNYMDRRNVRVAGGRGILEHTTKYAPYLEPYDSNNPGGFNGPDQIDNNDAENPVRVQENGDNERGETRLSGNIYGEMNVISGLTLRTVLGMESFFGKDYTFVPRFEDGEFHAQPFATVNEVRTTYFAPISTTTLNYDRSFGVHTVNAVGGFEYQTAFTRSAGAEGQNPLTDDLRVLGTVEQDLAVGQEFRDVMISYFARLNYNYDDRYLLQGSLRRDGYSRFSPDNRFGIFPSISAGWNVAEEAFLEDGPFGMLKLRASYGEVGNNNAINPYEYLPTVSTNYFYTFGGDLVSAATIPGLANEVLRWESTNMLNIGTDIGVLDNALTFSVEYYKNTTEDILLTVPLPGSFGFDQSPRFNTGDVDTEGFEFELGYRGGSGDLDWDVAVNFGTSRNEVSDLGVGAPINGAQYGGPGHVITRVEEGEPLYFFYGWKVDRLYQESDFTNGTLNGDLPQPSVDVAPGDIKFVDVDGNGVINDGDRTNIGEPMPRYTYGMNASFNWQNVDLSFLLQGAGGHEIYRAYAYWTEGMTRIFNAETSVLDRWTPENTDTDVPRGIVGDPANNARPSERWVDDGDYLRVKLLTLGYTVPLRSDLVRRFRIYAQSRNLLTFTGYGGYDPEVGVAGNDPNAFTSDFGVDFGQYPQPRSFTFGLQLGF